MSILLNSMKKYFVLGIMGGLLLFSSQTMAASLRDFEAYGFAFPIIIGISGGVSMPAHQSFTYQNAAPSYKMKNGFDLGAHIGYRLYPYWRAELSFDYLHNNIEAAPAAEDVGADQYIGLLKGYFDLPLGGGFTPYIGGGIGYGYLQFLKENTYRPSGSGFAFQFAGGINYKVRSNVGLAVGYQGIGLIFGSAGNSGTLINHVIKASLNYYFSMPSFI
jgi:opacity protein-like surface antigen